jgi:intracellular multiplication protein IcmP
MAGQQQQGGGEGGDSMDLLWGVAFIVAICLALWFFARGPIIKVLFTLKLGEIFLISFVDQSILAVKPYILAGIQYPTQVTFKEGVAWLHQIGLPLRIPTIIIIIGLAVYVFLKHPTLKFKNVYTTERLRQVEKANWPQITPVVDLDLVKTPINEGPWAMGLSPMEFAKKYKLLEELPRPVDPLLARLGLIEIKVIESAAHTEFAKQMGPPFEDINKMPIHAKALFAIFAARANNDASGANKLTMQIAASSAGGKMDFSGVMPLLKKHYNTKPIAKILGSHGYLYTVLASMLELARTTGILPPADFLWLKPLDRKMWFMMNSTGRRTPFVEVAGAFSHWQAEKALHRKITQPMVDSAIKGLQEAVKMIIYTRDEE